MLNPVLTLLFDLFLVGSAGLIIASMVAEYRNERAVIERAPGRVVRRTCTTRGRVHARPAASHRRVFVSMR